MKKSNFQERLNKEAKKLPASDPMVEFLKSNIRSKLNGVSFLAKIYISFFLIFIALGTLVALLPDSGFFIPISAFVFIVMAVMGFIMSEEIIFLSRKYLFKSKDSSDDNPLKLIVKNKINFVSMLSGIYIVLFILFVIFFYIFEESDSTTVIIFIILSVMGVMVSLGIIAFRKYWENHA